MTIEFASRAGVWWAPERQPIARAQDTAAELEELGCGSLWIPEAFGREVLTQSAALLRATRSLVIGTGIANLHARDPLAAEAGSRTLCALHPGRFVLGLGVSHGPLVTRRSGTYEKPLSTMRRYLELMDAVPDTVEPGAGRAPRVLAALGPRMLELAASATAGAHTYLVTPEHTATAREVLGPDATLVVEQGVALSTDRAEALRWAHSHLEVYSGLPNYRNNWLRLGFAESDLVRGGSDRLAEATVAMGTEQVAVERVRAHLDAGADHVLVQIIGAEQPTDPVADIRRLWPGLTEL